MLHKNRVEKLRQILVDEKLDAIYIGPSADAQYIADIDLFDDERVKGLMVAKSGKVFVMTPLLYEEEFQHALGQDVSYKVWADQEGFEGAFHSGCDELSLVGGRIAINDGVRAVDLINMTKAVPFEFFDGTATLSPLRRCKDEAELDLLRESSAINDAVMAEVPNFLRVGMKERDVKKRLVELFAENGIEGQSIFSIVAAGPGGSMPHYMGGDKVIERGDFVVIDMGCRYRRYCSDMTRTFCMGEPDAEQRKIYEIVLAAQKAGEAAVKPGATGQDVDRAAHKVIQDAGYGDNFLSRVGHGVGIAVHEEPYIIEGNKRLLEPGNVFSVEPGIYIAGKYGVRIENLVAVKPDGTGEALNKLTRELIVID